MLGKILHGFFHVAGDQELQGGGIGFPHLAGLTEIDPRRNPARERRTADATRVMRETETRMRAISTQ